MDDSHLHGPSLIESLWRYRVVVLAVPLLFGAIGYGLASQQTPTYLAGARLFLSDPARTPGLGDTFSNRIDPEEFIPQQAARATSRAVYDAARELLDDPPSQRDMIDRVDVRQTPEDLSLTITATSEDPEEAADIANAMAEAFMLLNVTDQRDAANRAVQELEQQIDDLETRLIDLEEQLGADPQNFAVQSQIQNLSLRLIDTDRLVSTVRIEAELRGNGVDAFEAAVPPTEPSSPRIRLQTVGFALVGGVLASLWAYWRAGRSQRAVSRTDPERILRAPLLGEIPLHRLTGEEQLHGLIDPDPAIAEAYQFVLSSVEFALGDTGGRSVLITSILPGDGKTTTSLQLGIAASRDHRRVVLVDADIRARGMTRMLGAEDRTGLSDLAVLDLKLADVMRRYRFNERSQLPVVTAGQRRGDPAALLRTPVFRKTMQAIRDTAELVLIDSSPILAVADATIVASTADAMVLVVSHGTLFSELEKARERLNFISTPLLGYVYNRSDATTAAAYGYGYGITENERGGRGLLSGRRGARRDGGGGDHAAA